MKKIIFLMIFFSFMTACQLSNDDYKNRKQSEDQYENFAEESKEGLGEERQESENLEEEESRAEELISADNLRNFSLSELEEDYDTFVDIILTNNTFTFSSAEGFSRLADELRPSLYDGMSEVEFNRLLARMISYLNCSHSRVMLPRASYQNFAHNNRFMPLDVEYKGDELFVVGGLDELEVPLGSEIISINSVASKEVVETIYDYLPSDAENTTLKNKIINDQFYYLYNLYYDNRGTYDLVILPPNATQTETVSFTGFDGRVVESIISNPNYGRSLTYEIEDNYVYLRVPDFNTIGQYSIADYEEYYKDFFEDINSQGMDQLIIDIRNNNGGDPMVANILLSYLAHEPFQYFAPDMPPAYPELMRETPIREHPYKGNVYVLCDGGSLSTSGHFLALFKYHNLGLILGQESGAGYTCTDSSFNTELSNTKLTLRTSSVRWAVDVEGDGNYHGIIPDYIVDVDIDDVINGKDTVLEYLLKMIEG